MTIAVTDACIFIDLLELHLLHEFFRCGWTIHTTHDVLNELYPHQQKLLRTHQRKGELHIHTLKSDELLEISRIAYPKSLSQTDCTVLFVATKLPGALILSGDRVLRNYARQFSIACHGTLGVIDRLVALELIPKPKAIQTLKDLLKSNLIYQNSREMQTEVAKRIRELE